MGHVGSSSKKGLISSAMSAKSFFMGSPVRVLYQDGAILHTAICLIR